MKVSGAMRDMSIQSKINLMLAVVFTLILVSTIWHTIESESELVLHVVEQQTKDAADAYFDSINTMMITGTMDQREVLREKMLARPGVLEATIIRGDIVNSMYGEGNPEEQAHDDYDRRALGGEAIMEVREVNGERVLTVLNPMFASSDYRGTNCLLCHPTDEGNVLGAVRVSYSLASLDEQVNDNLLTSAIIHIVLYIIAFVLVVLMFKRLVTTPIAHLRTTMEEIERDSNLVHEIDIERRDEVGAMAEAFSRMVAQFREGMLGVRSSTENLVGAAQRIAGVAEETVRGVEQQRLETEQVATAMNEMNATVHEVAQHAAQTMEASRGASEEANKGALVATEALGGIEMLVSEIEKSARVIQKLDQDSENIGAVVDVIKSIAEQTNLLALNAAIEAARAGEQGRGFAVVADEVRTLASRTQSSTAEIQSMIEKLQANARAAVDAMGASQAKAQEGSEMVEASAESLGTIAGEVYTINDMNTQIATAAEEQSAVAEEINRNIVNISQVAEDTFDGARKTADTSDELVRLANELEGLVSRFKL